MEDTLFRVHRYFFTRESAFFRSKLPHPPPPGEFTKGSSDAHPLVLEDTLEVDFERFLWVFYNPCVYGFHTSPLLLMNNFQKIFSLPRKYRRMDVHPETRTPMEFCRGQGSCTPRTRASRDPSSPKNCHLSELWGGSSPSPRSIHGVNNS